MKRGGEQLHVSLLGLSSDFFFFFLPSAGIYQLGTYMNTSGPDYTTKSPLATAQHDQGGSGGSQTRRG